MIDINNPFINSGLSFQIILIEPENQEIFSVDDEEVTVGHVSEYKNKALKVISVKVVEGRTYGLLAKSDSLIGWTVLNESIRLFSKDLDTVKIIEDDFITPEINNELGFTYDYKLLFQNKILSSRALYKNNDEIFEAIFLKGSFVGFVRSKDVDRGIFKKAFIELNDEAKVFIDSGLTNEAKIDGKTGYKIESDLVFINSKRVRVTINKKKYWVHYNDVQNNQIFDNEKETKFSKYSDLELEQLDLISRFKEERNESKSAIVRLIKENIILQKNAKDAGEYQQYSSSQYEKLYTNLKNSKLGKIQTKYWSWKNRRSSN